LRFPVHFFSECEGLFARLPIVLVLVVVLLCKTLSSDVLKPKRAVVAS